MHADGYNVTGSERVYYIGLRVCLHFVGDSYIGGPFSFDHVCQYYWFSYI